MPKNITFDRDATLERVTRLFWKKGYNGTSMQDLVEVTELNRSSLYNTFGDKFTLFTEALEHYQTMQDSLLANMSQAYPSPRQVIEMVFHGVVEELKEGKRPGCFLVNCATELANNDPKMRVFLSENYDRITDLLQKLIEDAQSKGEIAPNKDPQTLADQLFTMLQGMRVTSLLDIDIRRFQRMVDSFIADI